MSMKSGFEKSDNHSAGAPKNEFESSPIYPDEETLADRRTFLQGAMASAAALALPKWTRAAVTVDDMSTIHAEIEKRHDEAVQRLQHWIQQPSIAAENRGMTEGCELTMNMLRDAGFEQVTKVPTDGQPGIFATLDAGAPRTVGLYFMYDVKQADPAEWSSPPFEAALVDKPGLGKVIVGRGAVNQKGPEATFLAALHAMRGAGKKIPVNFVFVAEGEEEIGSPHFPQVVRKPEVAAALKKCTSVFMPFAAQGPERRSDRLLWVPKALSSSSWFRAERAGAAVPRRTCTPATKPAWTARRGIWSRRWRHSSRQMATTR